MYICLGNLISLIPIYTYPTYVKLVISRNEKNLDLLHSGLFFFENGHAKILSNGQKVNLEYVVKSNLTTGDLTIFCDFI